jgi:hypothetical protein
MMQLLAVCFQRPNVRVALAAWMFAAAGLPALHAEQVPTVVAPPGSSSPAPSTEVSGVGGRSNADDDRVLQLEKALKYERQINDELMKKISVRSGDSAGALGQKLDTATRDIEQSLDELRAISRP